MKCFTCRPWVGRLHGSRHYMGQCMGSVMCMECAAFYGSLRKPSAMLQRAQYGRYISGESNRTLRRGAWVRGLYGSAMLARKERLFTLPLKNYGALLMLPSKIPLEQGLK